MRKIAIYGIFDPIANKCLYDRLNKTHRRVEKWRTLNWKMMQQ